MSRFDIKFREMEINYTLPLSEYVTCYQSSPGWGTEYHKEGKYISYPEFTQSPSVISYPFSGWLSNWRSRISEKVTLILNNMWSRLNLNKILQNASRKSAFAIFYSKLHTPSFECIPAELVFQNGIMIKHWIAIDSNIAKGPYKRPYVTPHINHSYMMKAFL